MRGTLKSKVEALIWGLELKLLLGSSHVLFGPSSIGAKYRDILHSHVCDQIGGLHCWGRPSGCSLYYRPSQITSQFFFFRLCDLTKHFIKKYDSTRLLPLPLSRIYYAIPSSNQTHRKRIRNWYREISVPFWTLSSRTKWQVVDSSSEFNLSVNSQKKSSISLFFLEFLGSAVDWKKLMISSSDSAYMHVLERERERARWP